MIKKIIIIFSLLVWTSLVNATPPINIIVPFTPGGGTDIVAKRFQKFIKEKNNIDSIILYKPGAEGLSGTVEVSKTLPNGTTIGITTVSAVAASMVRDTSIKFELVSSIESNTMVLVTNSGTGIKRIEDFENIIKKNTSVRFGSGAVAQKETINQLLNSLDKSNNAIVANYKGSSNVLTDLLGEHIDIAILPAQMITSDKLIILASNTAMKNHQVPTFANRYSNWTDYFGYCLIMPPGSSKEEIARWEQLIIRYVKDTEIKEQINNNFAFVLPTGKEKLSYTISRLLVKLD